MSAILLSREDDSKFSFASFAPSREILVSIGRPHFLTPIFLPIPIAVVIGGFRTSTTPYSHLPQSNNLAHQKNKARLGPRVWLCVWHKLPAKTTRRKLPACFGLRKSIARYDGKNSCELLPRA
jgi:hypothetical protein